MADPELQPPPGGLIDRYGITTGMTDAADFGPMVTLDQVPEPPPAPEPIKPFSDLDFDPQSREDFIGLTKLGYLDAVVTLAGHKFRLITPSTKDMLEAGLLHRQYLNSMSSEPAWRQARVAAYIAEIDGTPAPAPLGGATGPVATRYNWLLESVYSELVMRMLFSAVLDLEERVVTILNALDGQGKD